MQKKKVFLEYIIEHDAPTWFFFQVFFMRKLVNKCSYFRLTNKLENNRAVK